MKKSFHRRDFLGLAASAGVCAIAARPFRLLAAAEITGEVVARADQVMGTIAEIFIRHPDRRFAVRAAEAALDALRAVDRGLSHFSDTSDVGRLALANGSWTDVSAGFIEISGMSARLNRSSGGAFDPAAGAAVRLWKAAARRGAEPYSAEIAAQPVGFDHLELETANRRARLTNPQVRLDFGAIGKGYGADRAAEALKSLGVESALVAVSGDIRVVGRLPVQEVAIQDPHDPDGSLAVLELDDAAVSTSGDYEQGLWFGKKRRSHLIDPRTKEPVAAPPASVTVIAPVAAEADALSSAVFVMGAARGLELIGSLPGRELLVADASLPGGRVMTPGFARYLRPEPRR
ncbi:MAG: FAD:protein FMN transferase [Deltaproteobacteria bacterium]|nr:FAD:protein FMN transferase [Deltaproteobacteria bacterium]